MVGFVDAYVQSDWASDIAIAHSKGIDGFVSPPSFPPFFLSPIRADNETVCAGTQLRQSISQYSTTDLRLHRRRLPQYRTLPKSNPIQPLRLTRFHALLHLRSDFSRRPTETLVERVCSVSV